MVEKKVIEGGNKRVFFWKNSENGNLNLEFEVKGLMGVQKMEFELTRNTFEKLQKEAGWA